MRRIIAIAIAAWLWASGLSAASVECTFIGIEQNYESRVLETTQYNFDYHSDSPGLKVPFVGPYQIEIFSYEGNFNIGIEIAKKAISSISVPFATLKRISVGETIFGFINAYHVAKNGFMAVRYECIMTNQSAEQ